MGFKKEKYVCLLSFLFIVACGQSEDAGFGVPTYVATEKIDGTSLGEPETNESLILEDEISQHLVVEDDVFGQGEDFSQLSDKEIEDAYADDLESLNTAIDTFAQTGLLVPQETMLAAKTKKKGGGGMSGMSCLGLGIQGEAGGESHEGMVAVGRTLLRRAGGSIAKVCSALFARGQFESMQKRNRKVSAASLRAAQASVAAGSWPYDHFINKVLQRRMGRKIPQWVRNFEKWGCLVKNVGAHTFYASKNCKRK